MGHPLLHADCLHMVAYNYRPLNTMHRLVVLFFVHILHLHVFRDLGDAVDAVPSEV